MDEREVSRVVRGAAESVYGVAAIVGPGLLDRLRARLNIGSSGVAVTAGPPLSVTVDIEVAPGVPSTTVATNVAEKVRYVVERDLARHIAHLTVRVDGRPVATGGATASSGTAGSASGSGTQDTPAA